MKKTFLLFIIYILIFKVSYAQNPGEWMWIHGNKTTDSPGNFGTQGVPAASNEPPALYEACEWTDLNGNLWLYGGEGSLGYQNDLWRYNPISNEWTWMTGTNTVNDPGNYGIKGVASPTNRPPSKADGIISWVDLNGNLWMFGGSRSIINYSDLWKYDISTNEWTWMKDSVSGLGIYGTQGVADTNNYPPGRNETAAAWTDNSGDMWLFGGHSGNAFFNDLWRFNIATNSWTWMKGSNLRNQLGVYGTLGIENAANTPGARNIYSKWKDKQGNLWIFGGNDSSYKSENDLWRYNPATNNWTWVSGSSTVNAVSVYGTKCVTAPANVPGRRTEGRASWTDSNGNFWLFGGVYLSNELNDLWMYCVSSNQWTWMSGDNVTNYPGSWGTKGVSSSSNRPSGRDGSIAWRDNNGHLYLFGGWGYYNDLWAFRIDSSCGTCLASIPVADFASSDSVFCTYSCIDFTDKSINATSWQWSFAGGSPPTSTDQNPKNICYTASGIYDVKLIASNSGGSDSVAFSNYIDVIPAPPTPAITQHADTLYCSTDPSYTSYQWYADTNLIPGATDTLLIVSKNGNYNVKVTNENGCQVAVGINITIGIRNYSIDNSFTFYPDPVVNELRIRNNGLKIRKLDIYNLLGMKIYSDQQEIKSKEPETIIDVSVLSPGIYFVMIIGEKVKYIGRFVKE